MKSYTGGCHCGAVRFAIEADIRKVTDCNCSICAKKAMLYHWVPPERFRMLTDEESLATYRFGSREAKHHFCRHCGIHVFTRPRSAPHLYSVNVRVLDGYDLEVERPEVVRFDGRHWDGNEGRGG